MKEKRVKIEETQNHRTWRWKTPCAKIGMRPNTIEIDNQTLPQLYRKEQAHGHQHQKWTEKLLQSNTKWKYVCLQWHVQRQRNQNWTRDHTKIEYIMATIKMKNMELRGTHRPEHSNDCLDSMRGQKKQIQTRDQDELQKYWGNVNRHHYKEQDRQRWCLHTGTLIQQWLDNVWSDGIAMYEVLKIGYDV